MEKRQLFSMHGCDVKSGREAWVRGYCDAHSILVLTDGIAYAVALFKRSGVSSLRIHDLQTVL